jgi:cell division protein FtsZ
MGDDIRVTVVATGLGRAKKNMQLVQTPMLRTGTHNTPMMDRRRRPSGGRWACTGLGGQTGDGMKQPAVWRREQASEQVQAMQRNGVETYDIPAFLRKQAD